MTTKSIRFKRKKKPPITKRFCISCYKETVFKYDSNTFHSYCVECGGFLARKLKEVFK